MAKDPNKGRIGLERWLRTNQGVSVVLTVILLIYLFNMWFSTWVHHELRDGFTLGFFPILGMIAMVLCSMALSVDRFRNEIHEEMNNVDLRDLVYCVGVSVVTFVFFELMLKVGFLLAGPVFLFGLIYFFGVRPWRSALISAVIIAVCVYALFRTLGIALPSGILPF